MYGAKPRLVPAPRGDGTFDVAWQPQNASDKLYITHVEPEGDSYKAAFHLSVSSLGLISGLTITDNGEPLVITAIDEDISGSVEPAEMHRDGILQAVRVGTDCQEVYRKELRTDFGGDSSRLPVYRPMTAGNGRLALGDGAFILHYSQNTEYDDGVKSRHQIGRYLKGDAASGDLVEVYSDISHSFEQRLHFDGTSFISLSLGDASLRGVAATLLSPEGSHDQRTLFGIKGGDSATGGGYNNTFTRLGDIAKSKSGYVAAFSTEPGTDLAERVNVSRNIAFVHIADGFESIDQPSKYEISVVDTGTMNSEAESYDVNINDYFGNSAVAKNTGIVWVTSYDDRESAHVERPKLVRFSDSYFFLIWEKWTLDAYDSTAAMIVDEWGKVVVPETSLGQARIPRGDDAFLLNGEAAWLDGDAGQLTLHLLNAKLEHRALALE